MLTASTQISYSMRANFLGGQNKGLIRTGDANPPQILKLCDAERRFVPKIELLACNAWRSSGDGAGRPRNIARGEVGTQIVSGRLGCSVWAGVG